MELTKEQLERQDTVDNAIHLLLIRLGCHSEIPWNIEHISLIRDAFQEVIVDKLHLMTEMEFYPYIETEEEVNDHVMVL